MGRAPCTSGGGQWLGLQQHRACWCAILLLALNAVTAVAGSCNSGILQMTRFPQDDDACFSGKLSTNSIKAICAIALRVRVKDGIVKVVPLEQGTYNYSDVGPDPTILQFNCKDINASGIFRPGGTTSASVRLYDDFGGALSNLTKTGPKQISLTPGTTYRYQGPSITCIYNYTVTEGCVFGIKAHAKPVAACPVGYYKKKGIFNNSFCAPCPAGTYASKVGAVCKPCPPGTHSPIYGGTNCTKCDPGTYAPTAGAINCEYCDASSQKWTNGVRCSQCPKGSFVAPGGKPQCLKCQAGKKCCTLGWGKDCPKCADGSAANTITSIVALESTTPATCIATSHALCAPKIKITVDRTCTITLSNLNNGKNPDSITFCSWITSVPIQGSQLTLADIAKFDYPSSNTSILSGNFTRAASPYLDVYIPSTKCTLRYRALTTPVATLLGAAPKLSKATTCPAGQYLEAATDTKPGPCLPCPLGSYSPSRSSASACTPCPAGTYTNRYASTKCKKCPAGQASYPGSASCRLCNNVGLPKPDGTGCVACPKDTNGAGPRCLGNAYGNICCASGDCKGQALCKGPLISTGIDNAQYYSAIFQVTSRTLPQPACKSAGFLSCMPLNGKLMLSFDSSGLSLTMDPYRAGSVCSSDAYYNSGAFQSTKSAVIKSYDFTLQKEVTYGLLSDSSRGTVSMYLSSSMVNSDEGSDFPAKVSPECSITLKLLSGYAFDLAAPRGASCDPSDAVISYQGRKFCRPCAFAEFVNRKKQCQVCPNGYYNDKPGSSTCKPCPVGYSCSFGVRNPCGAGYYSSKRKQRTCATCPANTYSSSSFDMPASKCTPCPKGTTAPQGARACAVPWDMVFPA